MSVRAAPVLALVFCFIGCAGGEPPASSSAGVGGSGVSSVSGASSGGIESSGGVGSSSGGVEPTTAGGGPTTGVGTSGGGDGSSGPVTTTMMGVTTTGGAVGTSEGGESGEEGCGGPCEAPPRGCLSAVGACVAGECVYAPVAADVECDDGDACTEGDVCDGAGGCQGAAISCERPHASGGVCEGGVCQGFVCVASWADCDSDWDNGCEVPVGVANQCDAAGLNPEGGCWTAYCGQLDDAKARNFGTFYCYDCSTCNTPAPGLWQWCNHTTGNWYPSEAGTCGKNEDLVCAPP